MLLLLLLLPPLLVLLGEWEGPLCTVMGRWSAGMCLKQPPHCCGCISQSHRGAGATAPHRLRGASAPL